MWKELGGYKFPKREEKGREPQFVEHLCEPGAWVCIITLNTQDNQLWGVERRPVTDEETEAHSAILWSNPDRHRPERKEEPSEDTERPPSYKPLCI